MARLRNSIRNIFDSQTTEGIGEVKIMVGERRNKRVLHYCITAK